MNSLGDKLRVAGTCPVDSKLNCPVVLALFSKRLPCGQDAHLPTTRGHLAGGFLYCFSDRIEIQHQDWPCPNTEVVSFLPLGA